MLRVMDLFSGIGGFSLGLKRAGGFRTVAYCEKEPYCQAVLCARMRDGQLDTAPIHTDITKLDGKPWNGRVDVITGGFPCQDISTAGRGVGLSGARSGLWSEMRRLICEVRPSLVIVENVPALRSRGLDRVLGEMAESGYDAEWDGLSASAFGAPHQRDRIWIVAYAAGREAVWVQPESRREGEAGARNDGKAQPMADPYIKGLEGRNGGVVQERPREQPALEGRTLADADHVRRDGGTGNSGTGGRQEFKNGGWWESEPNVGRVANGVPNRVHRLRALGNAIVPQIAEWIGNRINESLGKH